MARNLFVTMLVCASVIVMAGCAHFKQNAKQGSITAGKFGVNAVALSTEVVQIEPRIAKAHQIVKQKLSTYPPAQRKQLKQSWKAIHKAEKDVNSIISGGNGAAKVLVSLSQVEAVYRNAKFGYMNARAVVKQHLSVYAPGQQARLKKVNADAHKLAHDMKRLKNVKTQSSVNVNKVLTTALQMASAGAKIAAASGA